MKTTESPAVQHTPTPWLVDCLTRRGSVRYRHLIQSGEGDEFPIIAEVPSDWTPEIADTKAEANAAFIVRACNAHEGLVDSLRDIADETYGTDVSHLQARARQALTSLGLR